MSEPAKGSRPPPRAVLAALLALTAAGAAWRLAAFAFNVWPHGDVVLDAAVAESLAARGALLVPIVDVRFYPIDRFGFGYPPDQHPPLWPILGAPLVPLVGDGYTALKLVGLLVGVALVPLAYWACRPLLGAGPAVLTAALAAGSYLLVDFSGNGSLWGLLALFYLLFVRLVGTPDNRSSPVVDPESPVVGPPRTAALVGIVMGLAYLTNYPAVTLPATLVLLHLLRHGRRALRRRALAYPALSLAVMLAVVAPWLAHNLALFGNPLWSQPLERSLAGGSRQVEYVVVGNEVVKRSLPSTEGAWSSLRARAVDVYGNVGFVTRQLLVLTPVLVGFFVAGLAVWLAGVTARVPGSTDEHRSAEHRSAALPTPLVVLALVHLALVLWWPTTKFRYLVPLLPLVLAIGSWFLWQLRPATHRTALVAVTVAACLFTNAWTMLEVPSRTFYYDGGLVDDNFGGQGEAEFVDQARRLRSAADAIVARGPGPILGDHILSAFTHHPLVVNSTAYPPEVVAHLVRKYAIRYVVAERARADAYASLSPTPLWSDDRWLVLELPTGR